MKSSSKKLKGERKVKGWIEIYRPSANPTIHFKKPTQKEIKSMHDFGVEIYPCVITYKI